MNNNHVKVKGCGCRYRQEGREPTTHEVCDHLCDGHKNEFILRLYNRDKELDKMMESDAQAMELMKDQSENMTRILLEEEREQQEEEGK